MGNSLSVLLITVSMRQTGTGHESLPLFALAHECARVPMCLKAPGRPKAPGLQEHASFPGCQIFTSAPDAPGALLQLHCSAEGGLCTWPTPCFPSNSRDLEARGPDNLLLASK